MYAISIMLRAFSAPSMPVAKLDREGAREAVEVAFVGSFCAASGPLESVADDDDVWNPDRSAYNFNHDMV